MTVLSNIRPKEMPAASLLLIPGMLCKPSIWDVVIEGVRGQLGESVRVTVADVSTQASIQDMAQDAWACLDGIAEEVPCYVAGFSMGGYVALEMLAHQRRPVCEAWLISTSAHPESPESAPMREQAIANFERDFEKTIHATARWGTHERTAEELAPLVQAMRELGSRTAIRQTRAIMGRRDLRERLSQLDLPVHVMCGQEDRMTPPKWSEDLASILPQARLSLAEKSGHMMPFESPQLIAESICWRIGA